MCILMMLMGRGKPTLSLVESGDTSYPSDYNVSVLNGTNTTVNSSLRKLILVGVLYH
jgi:hypothetical protein